MSAVMFRLALLAGGTGLGEIGLDSIARGNGVAFVQLGLALVLLVAGSSLQRITSWRAVQPLDRFCNAHLVLQRRLLT
jgi:hypothetical protein